MWHNAIFYLVHWQVISIQVIFDHIKLFIHVFKLLLYIAWLINLISNWALPYLFCDILQPARKYKRTSLTRSCISTQKMSAQSLFDKSWLLPSYKITHSSFFRTNFFLKVLLKTKQEKFQSKTSEQSTRLKLLISRWSH